MNDKGSPWEPMPHLLGVVLLSLAYLDLPDLAEPPQTKPCLAPAYRFRCQGDGD